MIEIDEEIDTSILLHEIITDVERIVRTTDARTTEEEVRLAFNLKVRHLEVRHLNVHHLEVRHLNVHRQEIITDVERIVHTNDARTTFNLKLHHLNVHHQIYFQI